MRTPSFTVYAYAEPDEIRTCGVRACLCVCVRVCVCACVFVCVEGGAKGFCYIYLCLKADLGF